MTIARSLLSADFYCTYISYSVNVGAVLSVCVCQHSTELLKKPISCCYYTVDQKDC